MNRLVRVKDTIPSIVIDLQYAKPDNFVKQVVYDFDDCYLLDIVVEKLQHVQNDLSTLELGLKIWDGYRPLAAQEKFWEILPDERYVAHPKKGGRHTRGTAVDVMLVDFKTHKEVEMSSGFDDFTERAHIDYMLASETAIHNRTILIEIMHKYGFTVWKNEWWHFDIENWEEYPVIKSEKQ